MEGQEVQGRTAVCHQIQEQELPVHWQNCPFLVMGKQAVSVAAVAAASAVVLAVLGVDALVAPEAQLVVEERYHRYS